MTDEEMQAIQNLTSELRDQRKEMQELQKWLRDHAMQLKEEIVTLQGKSHSSADCAPLADTRVTVAKLWDSRNKFLGVAAGIGIGSGLGAAGILKLLGVLE